MSELLNFYSSEEYNTEIDEIVERTRMSYLDAMLYHADEKGLESETVAGLINIKTKTNAEYQHMVKANIVYSTNQIKIWKRGRSFGSFSTGITMLILRNLILIYCFDLRRIVLSRLSH